MEKVVHVSGSQQAGQSVKNAEPSAAAELAKEGGQHFSKQGLHGRTTAWSADKAHRFLLERR